MFDEFADAFRSLSQPVTKESTGSPSTPPEDVIREALSYPQSWVYPNADPKLKQERRDALRALDQLLTELEQVKASFARYKAEDYAAQASDLSKMLTESQAQLRTAREALAVHHRGTAFGADARCMDCGQALTHLEGEGSE
jgi:hypothetical protein